MLRMTHPGRQPDLHDTRYGSSRIHIDHTRMNIAIDMMGGDFAPEEVVKGIRDYFSDQSSPASSILLIGDEAVLKPLVVQYP
ncbi:MAG: hypothetical protein ABUL46_04975, partial [Chitinophaga rupis]